VIFIVLWCKKRGRQTIHSARHENKFLRYEDLNNMPNDCNLKIVDILNLVSFFFVIDIPLRTTTILTVISQYTVTDWFNMCHNS